MIHAPYRPMSDPERNWQARLEAEHAARIRAHRRHQRNAELAAFWYEIGGAILVTVVVMEGVRRAINAELFSWLRF